MTPHLLSISACCFGVAFLLYLLSALLYWVNPFAKAMEFRPPAALLARLGFASHTLAIVLRSLAQHEPPFINLLQGASFLAWVIVGLFLVMDWRLRLSGLGPFALPTGFAAIFLAAVLPGRSQSLVPALKSNSLYIHIGLSMLGLGCLALAFCAAVAYLAQERRLKRKRLPATLDRALSLDQADSVATVLVALGFACLTFGLILGGMAARSFWTGLWLVDPKVLISVVVWLIYGAYLYARGVVGWRGRETMVLIIWGFVIMVVGLVGVNLAGVSRHSPYSL
ncbi:MAG TPA: cytochrome c biogenesis protein CcsA [Armatimonadota bacterium]|jgi:cytochrome c-type biogenesis protein CcsB